MRRPLVRYHGGKFVLAEWIISHFPQHKVYCEPYGGGGNVLLKKQRSYAEIYNDLDNGIYTVFKVARDEPAEKEHQKAKQAYTRYIRSRIKRAGSAEAAARKAKMPPTTIREALKRGSYLAIRNCAHAILKAVGK